MISKVVMQGYVKLRSTGFVIRSLVFFEILRLRLEAVRCFVGQVECTGSINRRFFKLLALQLCNEQPDELY